MLYRPSQALDTAIHYALQGVDIVRVDRTVLPR